jgi:hypothetical protein
LRGRQGYLHRPDNSINAINARAKRTYDTDYAKLMDSPCPIHKDAKHTMGECRGLNKAFCGEPLKRSQCNDDETEDGQGKDRDKSKGPAY